MRNKPTPQFTFEKVIAELRAITLESSEGVFTQRELRKRIGMGRPKTQALVEGWIDQELVEFAGYVKRLAIDQTLRPVPAYRWIGDQKEPEEQ